MIRVNIGGRPRAGFFLGGLRQGRRGDERDCNTYRSEITNGGHFSVSKERRAHAVYCAARDASLTNLNPRVRAKASLGKIPQYNTRPLSF